MHWSYTPLPLTQQYHVAWRQVWIMCLSHHHFFRELNICLWSEHQAGAYYVTEWPIVVSTLFNEVHETWEQIEKLVGLCQHWENVFLVIRVDYLLRAWKLPLHWGRFCMTLYSLYHMYMYMYNKYPVDMPQCARISLMLIASGWFWHIMAFLQVINLSPFCLQRDIVSVDCQYWQIIRTCSINITVIWDVRYNFFTHWQLDCLFNIVYRLTTKKTPKSHTTIMTLCVIGFPINKGPVMMKTFHFETSPFSSNWMYQILSKYT